jgi:putative intracellular protease/amidase
MPGKVLIILSDAHSFKVTKSDGTVVEEETGFFLMELAKPLQKLLDAGYEVTVRTCVDGSSLRFDSWVRYLVRLTGGQAAEHRPSLQVDANGIYGDVVGEAEGASIL